MITTLSACLAVLGTLTAALILVVLAALIVAAAVAIVERAFERQRDIGAKAQYQRDKSLLAQHSAWFSESPATEKLLLSLAKDGYDIFRIRDHWREDMKRERE